MKTRGRPRHPEILTPRQHEVWLLLRQGLTNEEIAARLGISLDGAKYHVSEVLRRLGVDSRYEAAEWSPETVAVPASRRWAWAAAPLLFAKKLKPGALGYVASGVAVGAVTVGIALLAWGVVRSDDSPPSDAAVGATRTPIPRTNIPELDRAIDLLVRQDIDGLMQLVEFSPAGCTATESDGSPPTCTADAPEGSPVDVFPVGVCSTGFPTSREGVRQAFGGALSRQPSAAVYAILRETAADRPYDSYYVAITEDRPSQATANVSFWQIKAGSGTIVGLQNECGAVGAAQQVAYRFPINPNFVLGPFNNCLVRPGDVANLMVTVDSLGPGGIKPQFWGPAKTTLGTDTGGRAIVTVPGDAVWNTASGITRLEDVRPGMELEAVGPMGDDCVITAQTILAPIPPTPAAQGAATAAGCPLADGQFCGFAVQLQDALNAGDLGFLSQRLVAATHPCNQTFYDPNEDVGCPGNDGTSVPVVMVLYFPGDCCSTRPENFEPALARWLAGQRQDGRWDLYGVVPSAPLWGSQPEILLARGTAADAPTIGVGFASAGEAIAIPGAMVGPLSLLYIAPNEQLLRWRDGPWIAPAGDNNGLTQYRNPLFGVELEFPASWVADPNYGGSFGGVATAYTHQRGRAGGFIQIDALSSSSLDDAVQAIAYHKLKPYGDTPVIRDIALLVGVAKLILPDPNPSPSELNEATLIIAYPQSVDTSAIGGGPYPLFELSARPQDIEAIAQTLRFIPADALAASPTPSP